MTFAALGDSAVTVTLGPGPDRPTLGRVRALSEALEQADLPLVVDVVPAYATVTVFYDPTQAVGGADSAFDEICKVIDDCAASAQVKKRRLPRRVRIPRIVEIPVCYGGEFGPDLEVVAKHAGLKASQVISLHSGAHYDVQAIGFAPGFPYLAGLPLKLECPRRPTPRENVPAGSGGIGGAQTGVYPLATPGGWQIVGRTPMRLFRAEASPPTVLRTGDRVTFKSISPEEFAAWK